MNELKPCPFCGGEARRIDIDATKPSVPDAGASYIACGRCYACSPIMFGEKTGLEESWNRRALSAIKAEAKPQEPSEGATKLAESILKIIMDNILYVAVKTDMDQSPIITALITAHDDAIRREERKRAEDIVCAYWPDEEFIRAAILGKEAEK